MVATAIAGISGSIGVSTAATRFSPSARRRDRGCAISLDRHGGSMRATASPQATLAPSTSPPTLGMCAACQCHVVQWNWRLQRQSFSHRRAICDSCRHAQQPHYGQHRGHGNALAATHFAVSGFPANVVGQPFTCTVTALDQNNNTATGYNGTVQISNMPCNLLLPPNSTLTGGVGVFSATLGSTGTTTPPPRVLHQRRQFCSGFRLPV